MALLGTLAVSLAVSTLVVSVIVATRMCLRRHGLNKGRGPAVARVRDIRTDEELLQVARMAVMLLRPNGPFGDFAGLRGSWFFTAELRSLMQSHFGSVDAIQALNDGQELESARVLTGDDDFIVLCVRCSEFLSDVRWHLADNPHLIPESCGGRDLVRNTYAIDTLETTLRRCYPKSLRRLPA